MIDVYKRQLEQMRKAGYITESECDSLQALPLKLSYNRVDHKEGLATYFREYLDVYKRQSLSFA